jgi:methylmalonyl-CoA mutase
MLDFADFVAINKFDRKGAQDALRDVRKQYQRNRELWKSAPDGMPVFGTMAARFNDDGVTALYQALAARLAANGLKLGPARLAAVTTRHSTGRNTIVPGARVRYLAEIAEALRAYHRWAQEQSRIARERQQLAAARALLAARATPGKDAAGDATSVALASLQAEHEAKLDPRARKLLDSRRLRRRRVRREDPHFRSAPRSRPRHCQARGALVGCRARPTTRTCSGGCARRTCRAASR